MPKHSKRKPSDQPTHQSDWIMDDDGSLLRRPPYRPMDWILWGDGHRELDRAMDKAIERDGQLTDSEEAEAQQLYRELCDDVASGNDWGITRDGRNDGTDRNDHM